MHHYSRSVYCFCPLCCPSKLKMAAGCGMSCSRVTLLSLIFFVTYLYLNVRHRGGKSGSPVSEFKGQNIAGSDGRSQEVDHIVSYRRDLPVLWIGGVPGSGTTLLRVLLDAHPQVSCGEETRVITRVLDTHAKMTEEGSKSLDQLRKAGVSVNVAESAVGAYLVSILANRADWRSRLCLKEPASFLNLITIKNILPRSRFLLVVRDGRATCHSLITRDLSDRGLNTTGYEECLRTWNSQIQTMEAQCTELGSGLCRRVYYEMLVLHPRQQLRSICLFLDLPWDESMMHHDEHVRQHRTLSA